MICPICYNEIFKSSVHDTYICSRFTIKGTYSHTFFRYDNNSIQITLSSYSSYGGKYITVFKRNDHEGYTLKLRNENKESFICLGDFESCQILDMINKYFSMRVFS
jgi:hypothetical protein